MVLLVDTPAKPERPSMSESVPGSPNQELLRRLSYLSRGDDSGAEDGAEEEAVVEEYSSTEVKALPTPHYHLQKWFPDDPSSIPKETQQLWLDRPSTPLIDPDCFARRRNFVVSDVHVLLVNSDNEERRRLKLSLEALGYVVSGAASFPVAQRLLREHAGDYHANPNPKPKPKPKHKPDAKPKPKPPLTRTLTLTLARRLPRRARRPQAARTGRARAPLGRVGGSAYGVRRPALMGARRRRAQGGRLHRDRRRGGRLAAAARGRGTADEAWRDQCAE